MLQSTKSNKSLHSESFLLKCQKQVLPFLLGPYLPLHFHLLWVYAEKVLISDLSFERIQRILNTDIVIGSIVRVSSFQSLSLVLFTRYILNWKAFILCNFIFQLHLEFVFKALILVKKISRTSVGGTVTAATWQHLVDF